MKIKIIRRMVLWRLVGVPLGVFSAWAVWRAGADAVWVLPLVTFWMVAPWVVRHDTTDRRRRWWQTSP